MHEVNQGSHLTDERQYAECDVALHEQLAELFAKAFLVVAVDSNDQGDDS